MLRPNETFNEQKLGKRADIANTKIGFVDEVDPMNGFEMAVVLNNSRSF